MRHGIVPSIQDAVEIEQEGVVVVGQHLDLAREPVEDALILLHTGMQGHGQLGVAQRPGALAGAFAGARQA